MKSKLVRWGLTALMVGTLAACGGGGGGGDTTAAAPAGGAAAPAAGGAAPAVAAPTGSAPIDATALAPAAFGALKPVVAVGGVTIASPPCVSFSMADANNNPIVGFGSKSQSATATVASYPNLNFSLAKLIPGTGSAPSRWVTYIVTTVPTFKSATDKTVVASVPSKPVFDNTGTLTDNKNGTYTYCFYRDVKAIAAQVAASTKTATNDPADLDDLTFDPNLVHRLAIQISGNAPGTSTNTPDGTTGAAQVKMANPVNVIFDFIPATGKQVTDGALAREIVATANCNQCHQNLGGFPTATPDESDAQIHGGNRNDVRLCSVCHTDQHKYGHAEAVVLANGNYDGKDTYKINGLAVGKLGSHIHKIHMSSNMTKVGYFVGIKYDDACKFPQDLRNCTKCHDGSPTASTSRTNGTQTALGDNWKNVPNRSACGACHDGINFATGKGVTLEDASAGLTKSTFGHVGGPQSDDANCALCHKPADIDTFHLPVTPPNAANSLILGGTNANTNAASIASNTDRLPPGAIKVSYEIQSVSRNASKRPVMVFRMLQNGTAVPFNTFDATKSIATQEIWTNFMGAPSVYFVYAVAQDNTTAPADFNASTSAYLRSLWNGTATGTLTGPDAGGFYTATLTGVTIPDSAVMLTGGLGYSYNVTSTLPLTQTNLPDYPTAAATAPLKTATDPGLDKNMSNKTGGLIVVAPDKQLVAGAGAAAGGTGGAYNPRRPIVEDARCNKCHLELGPFTEDAFHAGQRNDGSTCAWCHNPNQAAGGFSGDSTYFVHAIHAAAKRAVPFTWHATIATDGTKIADDFSSIGYPGILNNCETCHLPGTYDFSAAASSAALGNRLYRTTAVGKFNGTAGSTIGTFTYDSTTDKTCLPSGTRNSIGVLQGTAPLPQTAGGVKALSPYITADSVMNYGVGFSFNAGASATNSCDLTGAKYTVAAGTAHQADGTTLVNSPVAGVCFSCHDGKMVSDPSQNVVTDHMVKFGGGSINEARTTALVKAEQCILCHGPNSTIAPIKAMHAK